MSMHCSTTRNTELIRTTRRHLFFFAFLGLIAGTTALPLFAQETTPAPQGTTIEQTPAPTQEASSEGNDQDDPDAGVEKPAGPTTALIGARILSMGPAGDLSRGTILIRDGKILAIGADIAIPADANTIDLSGRTITPGWIDLQSALWMTPAAAADSGSTASLDAVDGIDPYANQWQEVARQGITSVYVQPASSGILGGFGAVLRVGPAKGELGQLISKAPSGFQSSVGIGSNTPPRARISQFEGIKKRLSDAKEYREAWEKYRKYEEEQAKKKSEESSAKKEEAAAPTSAENVPSPGGEERRGLRSGLSGPAPSRRVPSENGSGDAPSGNPPRPDSPPKTEDRPAQDTGSPGAAAGSGPAKEEEKAPQKPTFDAQKERLVRVLTGELPLRVEVRFGDDAERMLTLAKEFNISIVLGGLSELGSKTEVVQKSGTPIILGPWISGSSPKEDETRNRNWIKSFAEYRGRLAIATFDSSPRGSKTLRQHLAIALAAGLPTDRALESVTTVPAAILGIQDRIGSLREGSDADLVVFAGNPLDPSTPILWTFSQGEIVHSAPTLESLASNPGEHSANAIHPSEFPADELPRTFAVRTKHLLQNDGSFSPGCLVIKDGMIAELGGYDLAIPEGTPLFSLDHQFLTPGLVVAHGSLSSDRGEDRQSIADAGPGQAADSFDPTHPSIATLVHGGFLRAGHAGGDLRVIAGPMAEVRLGSKSTVHQPVVAEKMVLAGSARSAGRFPSSLAGQQQLVREVFSKKSFDVPFVLPGEAAKIMSQLREARQDELISGQRPVLFSTTEDAEITAAIRLANEYGLKASLIGPNRLDTFAELLANQRVGVVVRPLKATDYDWVASDVAMASNAGVAFAFAGEDPTAIRATAAAAVQSGMAPSKAMQALTSGAATLIGMSSNAGSLQVSAPADFVLWSDSPLNLAARPLAIVVDGEHVDMEHP